MKAVAAFGHLRITEPARAVWPRACYAEQLARRTAARHVAARLLQERRIALGSHCLCLTQGLAAGLEQRGLEAQRTLDLSRVAGSTSFHHTLATRCLIERQVQGCTVAGGYLLLRRMTPFPTEALAKRHAQAARRGSLAARGRRAYGRRAGGAGGRSQSPLGA